MIRLPRWLGMALLLLFLVALSTEPAIPQTAITVPLLPVSGSHIQGTASLTATTKSTRISLQVVGVAEGTKAYATLHGGSCTQQGASAARLPTLVGDASDQATSIGSILFRGMEPVALTDVADGNHSIAISGANRTWACGVIPNLPEAQRAPLPGAGAAGHSRLASVSIGVALLVIGGSLWLKARNK